MSALQRLNVRVGARPELHARSAAQDQTRDTFAFKWAKRETYESDAVKAHSREWLLQRYCRGDPAQIDRWLDGERKILLDAGCGAGFSALLLFGDTLKRVDYLGVDISDAVEVARQRFREAGIPGDFLKSDLSDLPIPDESVDIVFSEGVLHHTDNTRAAVEALTRKLVQGGRLMFYVYARKAVIREFTDDYIRDQIRSLSDEEAWKALEPLTKLGMAIGRLNVELEVPDDIPLLGIRKGKVDLQRFVYWNICKLFYRADFALDEMNHINFDWFRPLNCHRHTPEELRTWCTANDLEIEHMDVQEAGITVVARKV